MSKKQYLTGVVHRLEDGVLKTYLPGAVAPEWVTNPKVLSDKAPGSDAVDDGGDPHPSDEVPPTGGDLDGLNGKELKDIADKVGVAKNGSLDAIRDRIRAKRAELEPSGDEAREALIEKLKAKGIEVDEQMSDTELEALDDDEE